LLSEMTVMATQAEEDLKKAEEDKIKAEEEIPMFEVDFYSTTLPGLDVSGFSAHAHPNTSHASAEIVVSKSWNDFQDVGNRLRGKTIPFKRRWTIEKNGGVRAKSEAAIVALLREYILAAINCTKLREKLRCDIDFFLVALRPDLLLVVNNSGEHEVPVGVIEVKDPGNTTTSDEISAGRLYDYLRMLHDIFGVPEPFGIMTSYTEWRFCWFRRQSSRRFSLEEEKRKLATSDIFRHDDARLPQALMYVLEQMSTAGPKKEAITPELGQYHLFIDGESVAWKKFEATALLDGFPKDTSRSLFLFGYLGAGAEGKVEYDGHFFRHQAWTAQSRRGTGYA